MFFLIFILFSLITLLTHILKIRYRKKYSKEFLRKEYKTFSYIAMIVFLIMALISFIIKNPNFPEDIKFFALWIFLIIGSGVFFERLYNQFR